MGSISIKEYIWTLNYLIMSYYKESKDIILICLPLKLMKNMLAVILEW